MEFTEEEVALSLANVSEERKAAVLETFRNLDRKSELVNRQRYLLKQELGSFRDELISMGVERRVARSGTRKQKLNPALWSTLPIDLLQLVFAHLPVTQIIRLRVLSKTWDGYVTGKIPGFTKVCAEVNPKVFGMLYDDGIENDNDDSGITVKLHDTCSNKWRRYTYMTPIVEDLETMCAGDGGLVCIVSLARDKKKYPLRIIVFNPLTKQCRELPELRHALSLVQPSMVQLVMDRETKFYKVIVVVPKGGQVEDVVASIYSSETGQWISAKAFTDLICGYYHKWNFDLAEAGDGESDFFVVESRDPCAFDCASGKLIDLYDASSPCIGPRESRLYEGSGSYALLKYRLFVLHKERYKTRQGHAYRYCILEYQAQKRQPHWMKVRVHRCTEFEVPARDVMYSMKLYGCNSSLLVSADNGEWYVKSFFHDLAWLYDLSTGKWQAISGLSEEEFIIGDLAMFELQWDAVP